MDSFIHSFGSSFNHRAVMYSWICSFTFMDMFIMCGSNGYQKPKITITHPAFAIDPAYIYVPYTYNYASIKYKFMDYISCPYILCIAVFILHAWSY